MLHSRRRFLRAAPVLLSACRRSGRPNILFAIADDWSWSHAGVYGNPLVRTPAFDRVAREGVLFTHSLCASPSCTPSRSAVLTGRHIWQVEEAGVLYGTIPPRYPLFPHLLEDAGYHIGYTGKGWGPGDWQAAGLTRNPTGKTYNARTIPAGAPPGIDARDYAANFDDFLSERRGRPFFFWFGATEPHRPYSQGRGVSLGKRPQDVSVPPCWPDSEIIRSDILDYYAEIEWFDAQLGGMLAALEKAGELDRTLVIVTSDNGMPFPRAKVNLYDLGVRMPLAIRWPQGVRGGRVLHNLVSHVDLAPTILAAAGLPVPSGMAGRSLLPEPSGSDQVFTALERHTWCRPDGATYPMRALRTRRFLYIRNFAPDRWPTGGPDFVSSNKTFHGDVDGCPTKDFLVDNQARYPTPYELCFGKRPAEEFYDVERDPWQIHNLAAEPPYRDPLQRHRTQLLAYLKETGDPRVEGRDPWQSYAYRQTTGYGATFNRSLSEEERRQARERAAHKPE